MNFEGLRKSIQASQMSNALKEAIGLSKGNTDEVFPVSSSNEKDQEEIEFIKGIGCFIVVFQRKYFYQDRNCSVNFDVIPLCVYLQICLQSKMN